jgi:hypothetical protein
MAMSVTRNLFSQEYFLLAPKSQFYSCYTNALLERFDRRPVESREGSPSKGVYEQASSYLDKVIDRQLNRARGLLTFNSILLALVNNEMSVVASHMGTRLILSTLLLLSCMLLLGIMFVHWAHADDLQDIAKDLDGSFNICARRTRLVTILTLLSFIAVAVVFVYPVLHWFGYAE